MKSQVRVKSIDGFRQQKREPRIAAHIISVIVGVALWLAHFGKAFRKSDGTPYPPMNGLLEFLLANGRHVSLGCMALAVFLSALFVTLPRLKYLRGGALWIAVLNMYLAAKLIFYENDDFFIQSSIVIVLTIACLVMMMAAVEVNGLLSKIKQRSYIASSVWICGVMLVATNLFALFFYPASAINDSGRLHGVTVNPQHLSMMSALVAPAAAYVVFRSGFFSPMGMVSAFMLGGIVTIEYMTGSRMGFFAVLIGILVSLRSYISRPDVLPRLIVVGIFLGIALLLYGDNLNNLVVSRFVEGREDSRSEVWMLGWNLFVEHPLFGVEPDVQTGRLVFVENFWLSAAIAGGIIGFGFSVFAFVQIVKSAIRLHIRYKREGVDADIATYYLSALSVIMIVSIFEAAPLGILATHTMLIYLYLGGVSSIISVLRIVYRERVWRRVCGN